MLALIGRFGIAALVVGATPSAAQEFCVRCAEPEAVYRCVITDPRPMAGSSLQLACVTALATDGKHGSCAVQRDMTVFQCDAPVRRVTLGPSFGTGTTVASPPTVMAPPPPTAPHPNDPPRTVLEAAQRAKAATDRQLEATNAQMREASEATSSFFQKSWRCVGSFFTKCGE